MKKPLDPEIIVIRATAILSIIAIIIPIIIIFADTDVLVMIADELKRILIWGISG